MRVTADLLVTHARPWSDGAPLAAADAVAVAGERVLAVGRASELEALAGPRTVRLDAGGGTVTPGLCDAHIHLVAWARSLSEVALGGAATRAAALARVGAFLAAHPGDGPVVGRGWDANPWDEPPDRAALDAATGERPVLLHSRDYHALWVNSAALRAAGVTRATPDPDGGRIERDAAGEPSGVVREHAVRLFAPLEAAAGAGDDLALVREAAGLLHRCGVTSVHDFEGPEAQRTLRALARGGALRVLMHLPHAALDHALATGIESGTGDDWFRIGALKLFADGTLGSRTAALLEPYDGTGAAGMDLLPTAELRATVTRALAGGLSVAFHAIGDRAVRVSLDAFEAAGEARARVTLPPRIEHVQLLDPADRPRFARLGVAASMQPQHCVSDMELVRRWWGARAERSYPWRSLLESGALLAFGSDAPVEPPRPALGLHAAVTRQRPDGTPAAGFVPSQRITLDQALDACTRGAARLAGAERLGRIAPGAAADLVAWDVDLHALPPARLHQAAPRWTVLAGEVVYRRGRDAAREPAAAVREGTA